MTPEPEVFVSKYEVSCLPVDHPERFHFTVNVEYRGLGRWAVKVFGWCYDVNGDRDYESIPSERRDEWLGRFRHDLDVALELARRVAPKLKCGGLTAADALALGGAS